MTVRMKMMRSQDLTSRTSRQPSVCQNSCIISTSWWTCQKRILYKMTESKIIFFLSVHVNRYNTLFLIQFLCHLDDRFYRSVCPLAFSAYKFQVLVIQIASLFYQMLSQFSKNVYKPLHQVYHLMLKICK